MDKDMQGPTEGTSDQVTRKQYEVELSDFTLRLSDEVEM